MPFEELGFPMPGTVSSGYLNRLVTHGTPAVAGAAAIGLTGIYLTIKNVKEEAAHEAAHEAAQTVAAEGEEA